MNDRRAFERFLADRFAEADWVTPPAPSVDDIISTARRTRPVPRWLATIKEPPMRISSRVAVGSPTARITAFVAILLTLSLLTAGGAVVGATLLTSPVPATACSGGGAFDAGPPAARPPAGVHVATLSDGRTLFVGEPDSEGVRGLELWEPATGSRAAGTTTMTDEAGVTLDGDRVLFIPFRRNAPALVWDPSTETVRPAGTLNVTRGDYTATRVLDDRVLVVGGDFRGWFEDSAIDLAEVWEPATGEFVYAPRQPLHPRRNHSATLLHDGRVLLIGGDDAGPAIATAETWDPTRWAFAEAGDLRVPRVAHQAVLLPDGKVLVIGGQDHFPGVAIADAELWDPELQAFVDAGTMTTARGAGHTATLLPDGRVLVIGGASASDANGDGIPVDTAEVWDPDTRTFSPAGSLLEAREGHRALLQPDCSVLVFGGAGPVDGASVERWVPGKHPS